MEKIVIKSVINVCKIDELSNEEQNLVKRAIEATQYSYAKYSDFKVGSALLLEDGTEVIGCNQENAAYSVTICAERSALFAAGAQYPDKKVKTIAIAARNEKNELLADPITPCGSCRQALIEAETRYGNSIKIILYGTKHIYTIDGIKNLMPLSFTDEQM